MIVVEEKRDFIETMIRDIQFRKPGVANVVGKAHEDGSTLFSRFGELDVDSVTRGLAQRLGPVHGIESARAWLDGPGRGRSRIALPLAIHAIGDRANHEVLEGLKSLRPYERENGLT